MANTTLILGPVEFRAFEIPAAINFGGQHRMAVHRLGDGRRVIDRLGRDDADIRFCGTFSGSDAMVRARLLDQLRALGEVLPLIWDTFLYTVVIRRFTAYYENAWWIPYDITCTVLRDEVSQVLDAAIPALSSALSDLTEASSLATIGGVDLASSRLVGSTFPVGAQAATDPAFTTAVAEDQGTIAAAIARSEDRVGGLDAALRSGTPDIASALPSAVEAAGSLGALTLSNGYVKRASRSLSDA